MVIYLDVLILINLYVTYFQILAVSAVSYTHLDVYKRQVETWIQCSNQKQQRRKQYR